MALPVSVRAVKRITGTAALLLMTVVEPSRAAPMQSASRVGDTVEITLERDSSQRSNDGMSEGSSHDQNTVIERVTAVRGDGLELEYDLPKTATEDQRASQWQFPARVFKSSDGKLKLLNITELETRLERWLKAANWPRSICGHWIFTWNAFRIDCDPRSVIKTVEAFDWRSVDLREGAPIEQREARGPGRLARRAGPEGTIFSGELEINPDAVRRDRAETDVAVGEIMNKPVTLDAALNKHARDNVSGTISIAFELNQDGSVRRRTKITKLLISEPDGKSESQTVKEVLERRLISTR
jgi:hypothetical protein